MTDTERLYSKLLDQAVDIWLEEYDLARDDDGLDNLTMGAVWDAILNMLWAVAPHWFKWADVKGDLDARITQHLLASDLLPSPHPNTMIPADLIEELGLDPTLRTIT